MISRSGFQRGAMDYADKCGIKLYRLHCPAQQPIVITDIGYAVISLDLENHQLHTTVFSPTSRIRFFVKGPRVPRLKMSRKFFLRNISLMDANGVAQGSLRDIVAGFVDDMRGRGVLSDSLVKSFDHPTFVRLAGCDVELTGVSAEIEITVEAKQSTPFGPWGVADFILEDLETGSSQTYKRHPIVEREKRKKKP
jgi:hypothetical protein